MAKQRHDIGYRKRLDREQPRIYNNRPSSPEALAKSLVRRGLAHPVILNGGRTTRQPTRTRNVAAELMEERRRG